MAQRFSWRKNKEGETGVPESLAPESQVDPGPPPPPAQELHSSLDTLEHPPASKRSVWRRGLSRLRRTFNAPFERLFRGRPFSEEVFDELEEALLGADVGGQTTSELIARLQERGRHQRPAE